MGFENDGCHINKSGEKQMVILILSSNLVLIINKSKRSYENTVTDVNTIYLNSGTLKIVNKIGLCR